MRQVLAFLVLALLAACAQPVPDSAAGVSAAGAAAEPGAEQSAGTPVAPAAEAPDATDPEADVAVADAAPLLDNPGISDEQDFGAVSERESIKSDAERLAERRKRREVITEAEVIAKGSEVNVVEYALTSTNQLGEAIYKRSIFAIKTAPGCRRFRTADDAQKMFLEKGGPKRDPRNLDPDGDGFACSFDPGIYRKMLN